MKFSLFMSRLLAGTLLFAPPCFAGWQASAHELTENRATIVKREERHFLMALYLDLPEILSSILEPDKPFNEFVLAYAALPEPEFSKRLTRAEKLVQEGVQLTNQNGLGPSLTQWKWPAADKLQSDLRTIAAQMLTAPDGGHHDEPVMVQAEFLMQDASDRLRVTFPKQVSPVLIVSYAPKQAWSNKTGSTEVFF